MPLVEHQPYRIVEVRHDEEGPTCYREAFCAGGA
jgi:hypothetical protein